MALNLCNPCTCIGNWINSEEPFRAATLTTLCGIIDAIVTGGGLPIDPVVDGYTNTVPNSGNLTITFSAPVNTVSLWSNSDEVTQVFVTYTGGIGNGFVYIPPSGSVDISFAGSNKITQVTFISQTSPYLIIANGVDTGA